MGEKEDEGARGDGEISRSAWVESGGGESGDHYPGVSTLKNNVCHRGLEV